MSSSLCWSETDNSYVVLAIQTLLARNYRGDIPMSAVEQFPILLSEAEEESSAVPPCFSHEGINVCPVLLRSPAICVLRNQPT